MFPLQARYQQNKVLEKSFANVKKPCEINVLSLKKTQDERNRRKFEADISYTNVVLGRKATRM